MINLGLSAPAKWTGPPSSMLRAAACGPRRPAFRYVASWRSASSDARSSFSVASRLHILPAHLNRLVFPAFGLTDSLPEQVTPQELKEVVTAFQDKGDANGVKQVQSTGIHVSGERYVVLKADERSLYGKKV